MWQPFYQICELVKEVCYKSQVESSIDDEDNENDAAPEAPKKPGILDTWGKVVAFEWRSLSRDDAWNIGKTVTLAGVGYYIFSWVKPTGPNGLGGLGGQQPPHNPFGNQPNNQPPHNPVGGNGPIGGGNNIPPVFHAPQDPFGGLTPEEMQEQREAFEAFERGYVQALQARQDAERYRQLRQQQEVQRQAELQRAQELQRQAQERQDRQQAELQRVQEELQARQDAAQRERWLQDVRRNMKQLVTQMDPGMISGRLRELEEDIRHWDAVCRDCNKVRQGIICNGFDCTPCGVKLSYEIKRDLILEIYAKELQQKPAEQEIQQPNRTINCAMCLDDKNIVECHVMSCCGYIGCKECFIEMVDAHVGDKSTKELNCPSQKCAKKIEEKDVKTITQNQKDLYERYLNVTFNECLTDASGIKHCPTTNCSYVFINDEKIHELITCLVCKKQYCSDCLCNHNMRITCEQAKKDRELLANPDKAQNATDDWIAKNTKPCPKCNVRVQKDGGCFYMQCLRCRHAFCWQCLQPHDHTNRGHPCGLGPGYEVLF